MDSVLANNEHSKNPNFSFCTKTNLKTSQ